VTVLDTGWDPGNWEHGGREEVRAMLRHTDIFMPNMEEARALTGRDDPDGAAAQLATWGPGMVIVKLGPDGALGLRDGARVRVPALATPVADTVGAGDCFNAGVLYALVRDWPLAESLRLGTAVAGYAIAGRHPRYATIEQARELMVHGSNLTGS
jgi:sugar/nucleoside kinase (ribokinase family)